ncbi:MAG TPA: hypothetical protein VFZ59_16635 [Verrucomicrobiae bacterium]|nr:hypothetical protein [Verrucomicrobiae bacterium]
MNSSAQAIGNCCTGFAALIYALPLQHLLLELSRKKDDGGGVIAGLIILVPMWLLLLVALFCVTASGGFDWLRLNRSTLYLLTTMASLSLATISFLRFEMLARPGLFDRIIQSAPIYLFPAATMLLVVFSLNPRFATSIPAQAYRLPWVIVASLSLTVCVGYLGYQLVSAGKNGWAGVAHRFRSNSEVAQKNLARIPTLDPQRDFSELLSLADQFQSRSVRESAITRVREHPDFLERLVTELNTGAPDSALEFLNNATLSASEQQRLAPAARIAMERFTEKIQPELRYMPKDRRKALRRWGSSLFRSLAQKFVVTGVDFKPAIDAFDQTLAPAKAD